MLPNLKQFLSSTQYSFLTAQADLSEEAEYFQQALNDINNTIETMPKTYEQDGLGDKAVVWLHYFHPAGDAWIVERDVEDEQLQAFGYIKLNSNHGELGYINIQELTENGFELDMNWQKKTIQQVKESQSL